MLPLKRRWPNATNIARRWFSKSSATRTALSPERPGRQACNNATTSAMTGLDRRGSCKSKPRPQRPPYRAVVQVQQLGFELFVQTIKSEPGTRGFLVRVVGNQVQAIGPGHEGADAALRPRGNIDRKSVV